METLGDVSGEKEGVHDVKCNVTCWEEVDPGLEERGTVFNSH